MMNRATRGEVIILDPSARNDWGKLKVIGRGFKMEQIGQVLSSAVARMNKQLAQMVDDSQYEPQDLYIVIDEWPDVVEQVPTASSDMVTLLRRGRHAKIFVSLLATSDDVGSLGLNRKGQLKDSFAVVYISVGDGKRTARVVWGNEVKTFDIPHIQSGQSQPEDNLSWLDDMPRQTIVQRPKYADEKTSESELEQIVLRNYNSATSLRSLERLVYGTYSGGNRHYMIKKILSNHNLTAPSADHSHVHNGAFVPA